MSYILENKPYHDIASWIKKYDYYIRIADPI